jgi:hypothetical protein
VAQAGASIEGMGGYVAGSNRYGSGDDAARRSASVAVPLGRRAKAAAWPEGHLRQTGTQDVTSQVVDWTPASRTSRPRRRAAGIMTKATEIGHPGRQEQLTQTRGQIEQLTAQRDYLKDQAA